VPRELIQTVETKPAAKQLPEQVRVRLAKLDALRALGTDPYPPGFPRTHSLAEVRAAHPDLPPDTRTAERVSVAGRVVRLRDHGGLCFATLRDWSGDLQVLVTADPSFAATVDLGDHVGVGGVVGTSRRGELSVFADAWQLTAKCLRPLPDKHRGLADPEALVRQRHVDLIVNQAPRDMVLLRSAVGFALRRTLHGRGYAEVETPVLQPVHGGANARPFITHSNAYDMRLFLRIAPELYLKRLAVGGVERVFEIGRNFRNEGVDATHNPEFTMLEAYEAYGDYTSMRALARSLILAAADAGPGPVLTRGDEVVDLRDEWPVIPVYEAVSHTAGADVTPGSTVDALRALSDRLGVAWQDGWTHGQLVLELYEHLVEGATVRPTFYTDFPVDVSPLTRAHRADPRLAERWDLVAFGMELGTAYTELVDPVELRARLTAQSLRAAAGDPEAMSLDEDFLDAFEFAMPPSGGLGLGVDRLVMLLTNRSIRETLPFPLVKKN
jgi:lysyl-tRNA synthetase class 2